MPDIDLSRRALMVLAASVTVACATGVRTPAGEVLPPVVFVHGNGDTAGLWITTQWRFESNGWPRGAAPRPCSPASRPP